MATPPPADRAYALPPVLRDSDDGKPKRIVQSEPPLETVQMLEQARDALVALVGAVFKAGIEIVKALIDLVRTVAGRSAAEAVDRSAASVLDRVLPPLPGPTPVGPTADQPAAARPDASRPPADQPAPAGPTPAEPATAPAGSGAAPHAAERNARVREILEAHADSDEERARITPAFVALVGSGVEFMASIERMYPGIVDRLAPLAEAPAGPEVAPERAPSPSSGDGMDAPAYLTPE